MRFYICAVRPYKHSLNASEFVSTLVALIPSITTQAKKELGEDVITVIATYEYAIGGQNGISKEQAKKYLNQFQEAVKPVPNVLLVPGTIVTLTEVSTDEIERVTKKEQKLAINYSETSKKYEANEYPIENTSFYHERRKFLEKQNQSGDKKYLGNTAHAFFGEKAIKHKKNRPISETSLHPERIYNLGKEEYLYDVDLANNNLKMGMLICAEQNDSNLRKAMEESAPFIEVVVSNGASFVPHHMFGALNVHVDVDTSCSGFFLNEGHQLANKIERVEFHNLFVSSKEAVIDSPYPLPGWTPIGSTEPTILAFDVKKPGITNPNFVEDIDNILAKIAIDEQYLFLVNNPGLIKSEEELFRALKHLKPQEQLPFACDHIQKINPVKVGHIFQLFQGNELMNLVDTYIAKKWKTSSATNVLLIINIAKALSPSDCFHFALKYQQHLPKKLQWFITILKRLNENDRVEFLKQSNYQIQDADSLIKICNELPKSERLSMLLEHKNLVGMDLTPFEVLLEADQLTELQSRLNSAMKFS